MPRHGLTRIRMAARGCHRLGAAALFVTLRGLSCSFSSQVPSSARLQRLGKFWRSLLRLCPYVATHLAMEQVGAILRNTVRPLQHSDRIAWEKVAAALRAAHTPLCDATESGAVSSVRQSGPSFTGRAALNGTTRARCTYWLRDPVTLRLCREQEAYHVLGAGASTGSRR